MLDTYCSVKYCCPLHFWSRLETDYEQTKQFHSKNDNLDMLIMSWFYKRLIAWCKAVQQLITVIIKAKSSHNNNLNIDYVKENVVRNTVLLVLSLLNLL